MQKERRFEEIWLLLAARCTTTTRQNPCVSICSGIVFFVSVGELGCFGLSPYRGRITVWFPLRTIMEKDEQWILLRWGCREIGAGKEFFFQHFFNSQFCKDQCFNVLWDTILHFLLSFLWIGKTCCSYQNGDVVTFERKHRYRRMSGIFFKNMVIESGRGFYFSLSF